MHMFALTRLRLERRAIQDRLEAVCSKKGDDMEAVLAQLVKATQMGASLVRLGALDAQSFDGTADALEAVFPGVESLGLAPEGVITAVYPRRGHEGALGLDLFDDSARSLGSEEAVRTRSPVISGPFLATDGKSSFMSRAPVFVARDGQERLWGFVSAIISLERLIALSGLERLPEEGYAYRLERSASQPGVGEFLAGGLPKASRGVLRTVSMAGGKLRLLVGSAGVRPTLASFWREYLGAVMLGLALSIRLYMLRRRPVLLKAAADGRTVKLRQVNRRLAWEIRRRRNASRERDASLEITRGMFEDSPAVKVLVDPLSLAVVDANPAAARFYGWPREKLAGMPITEINAQSSGTVGRAMALAMRGEAGPYLTRHRLATGEERDVEVFSGPVRKNGTVLVQSVIQDVTAREAALRELKTGMDRIESIFNCVEAGLVEADAAGRILFVNQGFCRMFGMSREKAKGLTLKDITHPDDLGVSMDLHGRIMSGKVNREHLAKRYLRASGEPFWGNVCVAALRDGSGALVGTVAAITDVTGLQEARHAAEETCLAKNHVLANIGHDLRSPLNAIMGLTSLTLRGSLEPKQRDNLDKAFTACRELAGVLDTLLHTPGTGDAGPESTRAPLSPAVSLDDQSAEVSTGHGGFPDGLEDLSELLEGLSGTRVLVVDDNPLGRNTVLSMLEMAGLGAASAGSGPEALAMLEKGGFDAVLLDIQMPVMDGFETLSALRALPGGRDLPVIALTGHATEEYRLRCFEAGMDVHLAKPMTAAALFAALRQAMTRHPENPDDDMPVLDSPRALSLLLGNRELYGRLLAGFVREYAQAGENVRRFVEDGRLSDAVVLAHSIKGLAANLGGERLHRAALRLEKSLASGDADLMPPCLETFVLALDEFAAQAAHSAEEMSGNG
jgi:PAS domain S-box-containing protein